jgi:acetyltransferase-like isoleucine patch superfamily enzyme
MQQSSIIPSSVRSILVRLAGVNCDPYIFIGENVTFDTIHPEYITIGAGSLITMKSTILTHYYNQKKDSFDYGKVNIGKKCFIGAHSVICQPVTIGDFSIIAAGAVVTKDIPPFEIWGGVPARFIKKREIKLVDGEKPYHEYLQNNPL